MSLFSSVRREFMSPFMSLRRSRTSRRTPRIEASMAVPRAIADATMAINSAFTYTSPAPPLLTGSYRPAGSMSP